MNYKDTFKEKYTVLHGDLGVRVMKKEDLLAGKSSFNCSVPLDEFIQSEINKAKEEMFHEINDGILDNSSYMPRKGRSRAGDADTWWSGVDDMQSVIAERLDKVRKKYKFLINKKI